MAGGSLPTGAVPLLFSHLMSRVRINIKASFDAAAGWPQRAQVALAGLSREATVDLAYGTLAPSGATNSAHAAPSAAMRARAVSSDRVLTGTAAHRDVRDTRGEADMIPLRSTAAASGYDASYDAIVVPQQVSAAFPLVRIALDGKEYVFLPAAPVALVSGETLTLNLTLTDR